MYQAGPQHMKHGYGYMYNDNDNDDDITAIVHNTVEFTLIVPLSKGEQILMKQVAEALGHEVFIAKSGRVIAVKADYVDEATRLIAECNLIEDVGLIKHITEYEIQHNTVEA